MYKRQEDIFSRGGSEFGAAGGGERDLHVGDGDGLVAVIGDDEKDGKKSVFLEVQGKDLCLCGSVVGVRGDGDFVARVVVVGRVSFRWLGRWLYKVFCRQG